MNSSKLVLSTCLLIAVGCASPPPVAAPPAEPAREPSAAHQLAALPDNEFVDFMKEFGLDRNQAMALKLKYKNSTEEDETAMHQPFLYCKQAGSAALVKLGMHEQCDRDGEMEQFRQLGERINVVQRKNMALHAHPEADGKFVHRGFHAKAHGCLYGKLVVNDPAQRPAWTRVGVFAQQRDFYTWTRFSNGSGLIQGDWNVEPRGMALKVLGVDGARASFGGLVFEGKTQDFLMTNKPKATTPDPTTFIEFAEATAGGMLSTAEFVGSRFWLAKILADLKFNKSWIANVAGIQYWSGVPISMGTDASGKMAPVKFFAQPCPDSKYLADADVMKKFSFVDKHINKKNYADYGRTYLGKMTEKYDICYNIFFQAQTDPVQTSVEDGLDEWTPEESKPELVAQLWMPKQKADFDSKGQNEQCEAMRFNPWNALADHTPMSDTMQARAFVYMSSAKYREGRDSSGFKQTIEPSETAHPLYRKDH